MGIVYTNPNEDVPSPIDLRDPADAKAWADAAETKNPSRPLIRSAIANELAALPPGSRILELGSGPGLLAEHVLSRCANVSTYTLFDFSEPMLEMSRTRVGHFAHAEFVLGDFKSANWPIALTRPYAAVLAMQAVHEIRHKRHVPNLYRQILELLSPCGSLWVADHTPRDASLRVTSLYMTEEEQLSALASAGFVGGRVIGRVGGLILVRGAAAAPLPVRTAK